MSTEGAKLREILSGKINYRNINDEKEYIKILRLIQKKWGEYYGTAVFELPSTISSVVLQMLKSDGFDISYEAVKTGYKYAIRLT